MRNLLSKNGTSSRSSSLRTRFILGSMIVTLVAVAVLGYYVYYRAQQDNAFLTNQLDQSVLQQANTELVTTSSAEADKLNVFFASMDADVTSLGITTDRLLSQEAFLSQGNYWTATQALRRLPNGSWSNSSSDIASVFIPAKVELSDPLTTELNTVKQLDFVVPEILKGSPDTIAVYFGGLSGETLYYPNIALATLVPPDFDVTQRPWFVKASPAQDPTRKAVWSDPYLDAAHHGLVVTVSIPVYNAAGYFLGVTAMDIQLNRMTDLVSAVKVGQSGYAFLIDKQKRLIALPQSGYQDLGITPQEVPLGDVLSQQKLSAQIPADFWNILDNATAGKSGLQTTQLNGAQHFIAYDPVPEVGYGLVVLVPSQELLTGATAAKAQIAQSARNTLLLSTLLILAILIISLLASLGISRALTSPLIALTHTAEEITAGNLDAKADVTAQGETGTLATALNKMTSTLREMIQSLEGRVKERTGDLERQADRMRVAAEVARDAASAPNLDELLDRSTRLICDRFHFYHSGIFLLDDKKEYAVLRASPTEAGAKMLENNHRLRVNEEGIVGRAAATGEPRIALDVGTDAVYFSNPLLPATHSEMALPLKTAEGVLGVLDVQSEQISAFNQDDIAIMQVMADQLATAIERLSLLQQVQSQLREIEQTYGRFTQQTWQGFSRGGRRISGYKFDSVRLEPVGEPPKSALAAIEKGAKVLGDPSGDPSLSTRSVAIPIRLRGQTIGAIHVRFQRPQSQEKSTGLIEQIADRLATALENARLLEEARQRGERDALVSEINDRFRSTLDVETVLKTAAQELQRAFQLQEAEVRLNIPAPAAAEKTAFEKDRKNGK